MEKIASAPFESGSFSDGFHGRCILLFFSPTLSSSPSKFFQNQNQRNGPVFVHKLSVIVSC